MKNFIFTLCALLPLSGCVGSYINSASEIVDIEGVPAAEGMIVLGERLEDPYAVENISAALASLYPTKADRVVVDPTDLYVRFLPEDDGQYAVLESLGLMLYDHPVDYEIVRDGDYYHDPSVAEDDITWQYTVVPVDFDFPEGIRYELLHECYLPDNAPATKSDGIDWSLVEDEAYRLTGNGGLLEPEGTRASGGGSVPSGQICIEDTASGAVEGVKGVKISCNSFVKFDNAFTDEEGRYSMSKNFNSKKVRYRLVFKNRHGFALGFNLIFAPASSSTLGRAPSSGLSMTLGRGTERRLYSRCAVNNAAYDYYEQCEGEKSSIKTPPANLRIWLFQNLRSSSAVMMHQGAVVEDGIIRKFLKEYVLLLKIFLPDITLGLSECTTYADMYSRTMHELAHASHYMVVGNEFWNKYINYVITSFVTSGFITYGAGTEEDHGYCEVSEMWAYYMQSRLYNDRYPSDQRLFGTAYWFSPQIFYTLDEKGLDRYRIFDVLGDDIVDRKILQKKMISMYPQFKTAINQAFIRYK